MLYPAELGARYLAEYQGFVMRVKELRPAEVRCAR